MNRIFLMNIKSRNSNIIYLACVWFAVFVFMNWSYASWHWLRPSDARLNQTYSACSWGALTLLAVEFILNYPSDKLWPRIVSAVLALLVLVYALPTL